jgi:hypothetical protein
MVSSPNSRNEDQLTETLCTIFPLSRGPGAPRSNAAAAAASFPRSVAPSKQSASERGRRPEKNSPTHCCAPSSSANDWGLLPSPTTLLLLPYSVYIWGPFTTMYGPRGGRERGKAKGNSGTSSSPPPTQVPSLSFGGGEEGGETLK